MLQVIKSFFERRVAPAVTRADDVTAEHAYQLATGALLVEMSRADDEVTEEERAAVMGAMRRAFELSPEETDELVRLAEQEADRATSLYDFTRLINEQFSPQQKERIIELMWRVAFADGDLDKYEEHLVRKIADLLYVPHRVFIASKYRAQAKPQRDH